MHSLYIGSDNSIILDGLSDDATGDYINTATLAFTVYRKRAEDGVVTAGSASLVSEGGSFVPGDVGKSVIVPGAGPDGSDLRTTISAVVSSTVATLADAASMTKSYSHYLVSLPGAKDITMDYVAGSNGKYRGILDADVSLGKDTYTLAVEIDAGLGREDLRQVEINAVYRG